MKVHYYVIIHAEGDTKFINHAQAEGSLALYIEGNQTIILLEGCMLGADFLYHIYHDS